MEPADETPARLPALLLACAVAYPLGDLAGGVGQLWALAGTVTAAVAMAAIGLWKRAPAGGPGRWALVFALALAAHAALVGAPYLAFSTWTKLAGPLALFCLAVAGGERARLSGALTAATLIACAFGSYQLVRPAPMPESWVDPERYHLVTLRLVGPLANPNLFGAFLATVLPVHAAVYACGGLTGARAVAEGLAATLAGALLLLTFSRGAWLAAGFGLLVLLALGARARLAPSRGRLAVLVAAGLMAGAAVAPAVLERLRVTGDSAELGVAQRGALYRGVLDGIAARPLSGWGLGSFQTAFPRFRRAGGYYPREAHSTWLHLAFEAGVPCALAYLTLVLAACLAGARDLSARGDASARAMLAGGIAGTAAACGAGMFVALTAYLQLDVVFWCVLALAVPAAGWTSSNRALPRALAVILALGGALWAAVAILDPVLRGEGGQSPERSRLELAVRLLPFRSELWHDLGESCEMAGDAAAAEAAYTAGLERDPLQGRFLLSRARVRARARRGADALADLDRAVEGDPFSEEALVMRGALQIAVGRTPAGEADLKRALGTNPQYHRLNPGPYAMAARLLAESYTRAGRTVDAAAMNAKAASLEREARR